jgi:hypothetical protein
MKAVFIFQLLKTAVKLQNKDFSGSKGWITEALRQFL